MAPGRPVCLLFGPQSSEIDESLSYIRRNIEEHPSLAFLQNLLRELPDLWSPITKAWPALSQLYGDIQLSILADCGQGSTAPPEYATNVLLTPLTVVRQIIDFWKFKENSGNQYTVVDTQGFCVGFLAAVAVACSADSPSDFEDISSAMIRLSVCIGAAVDLDAALHGQTSSVAVRWKSPSEYEQLNRVLANSSVGYISCFTDSNSATVTLAENEVNDVVGELGKHGLSVKMIALRGRFHHPSHSMAVRRFSDLCEADSRFRVKEGRSCVLPLRSNIDGNLIVKGSSIHVIALESILAKPSQWNSTVSSTVGKPKGLTDEDLVFAAIGTGQFVPRLVRNRMLDHVNNRWSDSSEHESLPNGINTTSGRTESEPLSNHDTNHVSTTVPPIAITGMGCRYAQANSPEQLWEMLELGRCGVSELPNDRFKMDKLHREPKGPFWGNYLANPDVFDHRFFAISAREAEAMDPQQRLLLEVAYEAMESAGYCGLRSSKVPKDIGCYVGVGSDDYTDNVGSSNANAFSATGTLQAFCTGRISHYFGWTGPSLVVDTACSSAAVAIHLACKALQTNECSIAVAGGVNVMTSPRVTQNLAAASFLSPTGASRAFDASANGYCRGEGAGLVVLRPLKDAIRNGDPILAVIGGSAVNQGSNCSPITVPDSDSQRSLYRKALAASGIPPEEVTYVEAHGTGTQVGDPIEFDSIRKTFQGSSRKDVLYVGSVKDNIGHTETASGVAGLLKTVLMMQKKRIPKQANFVRLNPKIPALDKTIDIPTRTIPWSSAADSSSNAAAMVTNYGAAGSNAALVVKQYTLSSGHPEAASTIPREVPIIIAATSPESLQSYCKVLHSHIRNSSPGTCQDLAYNLAIKQNRDLSHVLTFSIPSDQPDELLAKLESSQSQIQAKKQPNHRLPVVLCFGGQNGKVATLSKDLFDRSDLLQYHLMQCEEVCLSLGLPSLFPTIFQAGPIEDIVRLHCILFAIQYASAKSWLDSGLQVDKIIGHSFGQLTGLCVSGGLNLPDAVRLVSERAKMIRNLWGSERGVMLSVEGTETEVQSLLSHAARRSANVAVDVACINGPRNIILAGDERSIETIQDVSVSTHPVLRTTRLKNTHAFHSRLVDSIVPALKGVAEQLNYSPPCIPLEACSRDGDWSFVTAAKIVEHSRGCVDFQTAVMRVAQKVGGPAVWLEAGSASPIIPLVRRVIDATLPSSKEHMYQALDLGGPQAEKNLSQATCNLWDRGVKAQFWPFHDSQARIYNWINLPPYQFAETRHWIDYNPQFAPLLQNTTDLATSTGRKDFVQLLTKQSTECVFEINTDDPLYQECTKGHAVLDQNLCPASLYFEMIVRAATILRPESDSLPAMPHLQNLTISAPLVLNPSGKLLLSLTRPRVGDSPWSFTLFTKESNNDSVTTHATGDISLHPFGHETPLFARLNSMNRLIDASRVDSIADSRDSSGLKGSAVYQAFRRVVNYAEYYRGVERVFATEHEAAGIVTLSTSRTMDSACDPMLVDNFIQVAGIHVNCLSETKEDEVFVCTGVGEILIGEAFMTRDRGSRSVRSWGVYSNLDRSAKNKIICDTFVLDRETGTLAVTILSAAFTSVSIAGLARVLQKLNNRPSELEPPAVRTTPQRIDDVSRTPSTQETLPVSNPPHLSDSGRGAFALVQEMLCDLLGIAPEELQPSSNLEEVGVDSLMRTEVLAEIKKRFDVNITTSSLIEMPDVQTLVQSIFPGVVTASSALGVSSELQITTTEPAPYESNGHVISTPGSDGPHQGLIDIAPGLFTDIQKSMAHSQATQWDGFCKSVYPKQMELVTAYVVEAFNSLGVALDSLAPEQAIPQVSVLPQHTQVRSQLYAILEFSNVIRATDHGFVRTQIPVPTVPSSLLHQEILRLYPQHNSEHNLLKTTGSRLADCLSGEADPLSLLFQDAEARRLMEDVYTNAPMFKAATNHLAQYLVGLLGRLDTTRQIKILEIGGGTGGTTKALLSQLTAIPGLSFQYTFTDLSSGLLTLARKKFKHYDFMKYQVLNVEQTPPPDMLGQYDIIISSNCVHATRNLVQSCSNIKNLLRPDGLLCLIELTRNLFWFDLVFGLLEGWWLFEDDRQHALASEHVWKGTLFQSGFQWVDWTYNDSEESNILRVITASPTSAVILPPTPADPLALIDEETVVYGMEGGVELSADIYYPDDLQPIGKHRPIALLIHGGGHIMLSRRDIRRKQVKMLLDAGFLPVSVDYRLCPEVSLAEGPMNDVSVALRWARDDLPKSKLGRPDIQVDGSQVVAVGWSTGAHLAMTLAWTAPQKGVAPPEAILAFYGPTDYEDSFWSTPNFPYGKDVTLPEMCYDLWEGMHATPITGYNPPADHKALGGWMSLADPRSRIALHMNWTGQTLPMLLRGGQFWSERNYTNMGDKLPIPSLKEIQAVSPLAQIRNGRYRTPTFIIHGTLDDLIPVEQARRTSRELKSKGIEIQLCVVDGGVHLFDIEPGFGKRNPAAAQAVESGYEFLRNHVRY